MPSKTDQIRGTPAEPSTFFLAFYAALRPAKRFAGNRFPKRRGKSKTAFRDKPTRA